MTKFSTQIMPDEETAKIKTISGIVQIINLILDQFISHLNNTTLCFSLVYFATPSFTLQFPKLSQMYLATANSYTKIQDFSYITSFSTHQEISCLVNGIFLHDCILENQNWDIFRCYQTFPIT